MTPTPPITAGKWADRFTANEHDTPLLPRLVASLARHCCRQRPQRGVQVGEDRERYHPQGDIL